MNDVFAVADVLVKWAVRYHSREIDIIGYSGSRARGDGRDDSDLDIFFIPADNEDPPIQRTFLLNGLLFDFWAIRWETMEGFATGRIRSWAFAPALVYHTKLLYSRSNEASARLEELKQAIRKLQTPDMQPQMLRRALDKYPLCVWHLSRVHDAVETGSITNTRHAGWLLVQNILDCLALANQVFFNRGLANSLNELDILTEKPDNLEDLATTVVTSSELYAILQAADTLTQETRGILRYIQGRVPVGSSIPLQFRESYPELKDMVKKIYVAIDHGNRVAAEAEAWKLQYHVTFMLNNALDGHGQINFNLPSEIDGSFRKHGFPDLIEAASNSLESLRERTYIFDKKLRRFLRGHSIDLCEFDSIEELERALDSDIS